MRRDDELYSARSYNSCWVSITIAFLRWIFCCSKKTLIARKHRASWPIHRTNYRWYWSALCCLQDFRIKKLSSHTNIMYEPKMTKVSSPFYTGRSSWCLFEVDAYWQTTDRLWAVALRKLQNDPFNECRSAASRANWAPKAQEKNSMHGAHIAGVIVTLTWCPFSPGDWPRSYPFMSTLCISLLLGFLTSSEGYVKRIALTHTHEDLFHLDTL